MINIFLDLNMQNIDVKMSRYLNNTYKNIFLLYNINYINLYNF